MKFLAFLYGSDKKFDRLCVLMPPLSFLCNTFNRKHECCASLKMITRTCSNLEKSLLTTTFFFSSSSSRDGRMLFDYLAEKHGVSNSTDSTGAPCSSHDSCVNSALFQGAGGRGGAERGDVK